MARYYDGTMISEDDSKQASMPTETVMKNYPEQGGYMPMSLPSAIDQINKQNAGDTVKNIKPRKA